MMLRDGKSRLYDFVTPVTEALDAACGNDGDLDKAGWYTQRCRIG